MKALLTLVSIGALSSAVFGAGSDVPTYWRDITPILRKNCTACHSTKHFKDVEVSGGLALDSYEALRKGGKERVVEPGKSAASRMMQLIQSTDENRRMPLGSAALSAENIALV